MVHPVDASVGGADEESRIDILGELPQVLQLSLGLDQAGVQVFVLLFRLAVGVEQSSDASVEREAQPQQRHAQGGGRP